MNKPAPRSQDELLTELSRRLSAGADAWEAEDHGWVMRLLMAFIATWIREIAEHLRHLAVLVRDGKLVLQPQAPRQRSSRPASRPTQRCSRSPRMPGPGPAAAAPAHSVPLMEPEKAPVAEAPEPASRTPRPSPDLREWTQPPPQRCRPIASSPPTGPGSAPIQKMASFEPALPHAHIVP